MTLVEQLAEFASTAHAPADVADSVRLRVLDIIGLCAAAVPLDTSDAIIGHAVDQGGAQQSAAIGVPLRLPAPQAAFVNGVLAHSLDYDDTHLPSILHPSASVVPSALAAAEAAGASGAQFVDAVAVGLELCVRLGMAGYDRKAGNSVFFEHGQHATSICGAIAGAASAGRVSGLDATGIANAMGVAVSMSSGVLEANRTGGTVKRMHCGWAAHAAVVAADLVRRGFTAPPTILEGKFGFATAFLRGEFRAEELTDSLGTAWAVPDIFFKPYPANHFTHAAIDAAISIRRSGIRLADIAAIELGVATSTVRTIGEPADRKRAPATGYEAQFSGPYAVVAGLIGGAGLGVGLDDFTDRLARDPQRRLLMEKVTVVGDAECDAIYPDELPAILRVRLRDGSERVERVLTNRGGPQRPLSEEELAQKFRDNAARSMSPESIAAIADAVKRIESLPNVRELLATEG